LFYVLEMLLHLIIWDRYPQNQFLLALALVGKDIVFRFIIEYSSLKGFWPLLGNNNKKFIFILGFLKEDILAFVETWD
jgi:hypothetical protein